ncbi:hypothetical protein DL98DRAFT_191062 [Cadophora sp. DSE1049]|nr:hypothetical protein DL98DRAFT_191062 [Cadophora sp. DSE1049]
MYASLVEGSPLDVSRRQCCQGAQRVFPSFAPVREFGFSTARNRNRSTGILGRGVREAGREPFGQGWAVRTAITHAMWMSTVRPHPATACRRCRLRPQSDRGRWSQPRVPCIPSPGHMFVGALIDRYSRVACVACVGLSWPSPKTHLSDSLRLCWPPIVLGPRYKFTCNWFGVGHQWSFFMACTVDAAN